MERNYIDACKIVFRNIRLERSHLIDHFYTVKVSFKIFLDRPDTKQDNVDIFVKVNFRKMISKERENVGLLLFAGF